MRYLFFLFIVLIRKDVFASQSFYIVPFLSIERMTYDYQKVHHNNHDQSSSKCDDYNNALPDYDFFKDYAYRDATLGHLPYRILEAFHSMKGVTASIGYDFSEDWSIEGGYTFFTKKYLFETNVLSTIFQQNIPFERNNDIIEDEVIKNVWVNSEEGSIYPSVINGTAQEKTHHLPFISLSMHRFYLLGKLTVLHFHPRLKVYFSAGVSKIIGTAQAEHIDQIHPFRSYSMGLCGIGSRFTVSKYFAIDVSYYASFLEKNPTLPPLSFLKGSICYYF